jgi:hypothetical protein
MYGSRMIAAVDPGSELGLHEFAAAWINDERATTPAARRRGRRHRGVARCTPHLVLLCNCHHQRIHMPGWHLKLLTGSTLEVTKPRNDVLRSEAPPWRRLKRLRC